MEHTCPTCTSPLEVRVNRYTGVDFFGCTSYPNCNYTRSSEVRLTAGEVRILRHLDACEIGNSSIGSFSVYLDYDRLKPLYDRKLIKQVKYLPRLTDAGRTYLTET